ncbi:MAG: DUF423 domain-containing protein [Bacteroidales bacterium]|nr:DUF423 domain-containing protein [Bacteroidales bacterium]
MKTILASGVIFAFISIVMSALGSHALKSILSENGASANFALANQFMMYHALALILVAILYHLFPEINFNYVAYAFIIGSILFQGILYLKSFYPESKLGFLNPIGGSVLMIGWLYFLFLVIKEVKSA